MPSVPSRWTTISRKPTLCWATRAAAAIGLGPPSSSRSVARFDGAGPGGRPAAIAATEARGNGSAASRVPQYWQKRTSAPFTFPQRPHLIM